jgi:hypothetical protein
MTRKDAQLIIAECLIEPHFEDDVFAEATYILAKLEKAGMRPPVVKIKDPGQFPGDEFEYTLETWEEPE